LELVHLCFRVTHYTLPAKIGAATHTTLSREEAAAATLLDCDWCVREWPPEETKKHPHRRRIYIHNTACRKKQTDKPTNRQTNQRNNPSLHQITSYHHGAPPVQTQKADRKGRRKRGRILRGRIAIGRCGCVADVHFGCGCRRWCHILGQ
jgi:hypothetical protein